MHRKEAAFLPLPAQASREGESEQAGCWATGALRLPRQLRRKETDGGGAGGRRAHQRLGRGNGGRGAEHSDGASFDVPQEVRPIPCYVTLFDSTGERRPPPCDVCRVGSAAGVGTDAVFWLGQHQEPVFG